MLATVHTPRSRHLDALAGLFTQSLHLAVRLGTVKMGRVALDGTKLAANASKHNAMSYARLVDKEEQVEAKIAEIAEIEGKAAALLADAEATDSAEDATLRLGQEHGPARRTGPAREAPRTVAGCPCPDRGRGRRQGPPET